MEPTILTKNYQPPPPLKERFKKKIEGVIPKLKPYLLKVKEPKYVTLISLIGSLIVLLLAFGSIAKTRKTAEDSAPEIENTFLAPSPSPPLSALAQKVTDFESKLENSDTFQKALVKPIVELDLGFEKR